MEVHLWWSPSKGIRKYELVEKEEETPPATSQTWESWAPEVIARCLKRGVVACHSKWRGGYIMWAIFFFAYMMHGLLFLKWSNRMPGFKSLWVLLGFSNNRMGFFYILFSPRPARTRWCVLWRRPMAQNGRFKSNSWVVWHLRNLGTFLEFFFFWWVNESLYIQVEWIIVSHSVGPIFSVRLGDAVRLEGSFTSPQGQPMPKKATM